jgi:hypothetical protein
MSIDIEAHLQNLLDRHPESAEAVNIRICRSLHGNLRLLQAPNGAIVCQTPDVWGCPDLQLDTEIVSGVVYISIWASEHQYRVYAEPWVEIATVNTLGFGWTPVLNLEVRLLGWPKDVVRKISDILKKNPPIDW